MKKKSLYYFSVGFFCFAALYGCLWLIGLAMEKMFASGFKGSGITITANAISPNQEYIATTYTNMGGGAAGWCDKTVNLRRRDEPFDYKKSYVFNTSCHSDVDVFWESETNLLIIYTTDGESVDLYQKIQSDDGRVKISYLAGNH